MQIWMIARHLEPGHAFRSWDPSETTKLNAAWCTNKSQNHGNCNAVQRLDATWMCNWGSLQPWLVTSYLVGRHFQVDLLRPSRSTYPPLQLCDSSAFIGTAQAINDQRQVPDHHVAIDGARGSLGRVWQEDGLSVVPDALLEVPQGKCHCHLVTSYVCMFTKQFLEISGNQSILMCLMVPLTFSPRTSHESSMILCHP